MAIRKGSPVWVNVGTRLSNLNAILKAGTVLSANGRVVQVQINGDTLTVPRQLVRVA